MRGARELWTKSLRFRRLVTATGLLVAAAVVSLASKIPRSVALPIREVNEKCVARAGEETISIDSPSLEPGDLLLSYTGGPGEIADVWLSAATLAPSSARLFLPAGAPVTPGPISYTTAGGENVRSPDKGDTCHTAVEVRLAKGSTTPATIKLYQTEENEGQQLQLVLDAGPTKLEVEVHTDAPPGGATNRAACQKVLAVSNGAPLELPLLPVWMDTASGTITLVFNPASLAVSLLNGAGHASFNRVSIGDHTIRARQLRIMPTHAKAPRPIFEVKADPAKSNVSIGQLQIASDHLQVEAGQDTENALVYENGDSSYNYDLVAAIQKNAVAGIVLGILGTGLGAWIKKNCFPGMGG